MKDELWWQDDAFGRTFRRLDAAQQKALGFLPDLARADGGGR
jgi:hypothetical protein